MFGNRVVGGLSMPFTGSSIIGGDLGAADDNPLKDRIAQLELALGQERNKTAALELELGQVHEKHATSSQSHVQAVAKVNELELELVAARTRLAELEPSPSSTEPPPPPLPKKK